MTKLNRKELDRIISMLDEVYELIDSLENLSDDGKLIYEVDPDDDCVETIADYLLDLQGHVDAIVRIA